MRDLTLFFAALSDPTRLRLLSLIKNREICVCYLQQVLKTNQPKISRHLAYLKKARLVEGRRDGKWTHYRLKRQDDVLGKILSQTLSRVGREAQIRKDLERLKQVGC
ncbi:MAG TPA: metalloregulator ArsR/SmtB family transcription factor [Verrucomicrobiae bacterium]|jgi:ArsR family transcriptional regulator, arsenate/arsenite/antimonite-responsive transcriptional repressor|nr:metalloregulator ArsR/SmtB family transcription factor [Verrucomicrobiae bacterium]